MSFVGTRWGDYSVTPVFLSRFERERREGEEEDGGNEVRERVGGVIVRQSFLKVGALIMTYRCTHMAMAIWLWQRPNHT